MEVGLLMTEWGLLMCLSGQWFSTAGRRLSQVGYLYQPAVSHWFSGTGLIHMGYRFSYCGEVSLGDFFLEYDLISLLEMFRFYVKRQTPPSHVRTRPQLLSFSLQSNHIWFQFSLLLCSTTLLTKLLLFCKTNSACYWYYRHGDRQPM